MRTAVAASQPKSLEHVRLGQGKDEDDMYDGKDRLSAAPSLGLVAPAFGAFCPYFLHVALCLASLSAIITSYFPIVLTIFPQHVSCI
jgi:hypothetical protein